MCWVSAVSGSGRVSAVNTSTLLLTCQTGGGGGVSETAPEASLSCASVGAPVKRLAWAPWGLFSWTWTKRGRPRATVLWVLARMRCRRRCSAGSVASQRVVQAVSGSSTRSAGLASIMSRYCWRARAAGPGSNFICCGTLPCSRLTEIDLPVGWLHCLVRSAPPTTITPRAASRQGSAEAAREVRRLRWGRRLSGVSRLLRRAWRRWASSRWAATARLAAVSAAPSVIR